MSFQIVARKTLLASRLVVVGLSLSVMPPELTAQDRKFLDVEWAEIGGTPPVVEAPVLFPGLIAGDSSNFVVFDYGDYTVKALTLGGDLRWQFGGRGQNPGEFASASDLGVSRTGEVWVTDRRSARVTVVSPEGHLSRTISVPGVERAQPTADGGFVALSPSNPDFLVIRDPSGEPRRTLEFPARFTEASPLARDALVSVGSGPVPSVAVVFLNASWWFSASMADNGPLSVQQGVEPIGFPKLISWTNDEGYAITRLDPQAVNAAFSVGQGGPLLYVFFQGWSDDAGALVDLYETTTGEYVGSLRLPEVVHRAGVLAEHVVAAVVAEPIPHIKIWRWRAR